MAQLAYPIRTAGQIGAGFLILLGVGWLGGKAAAALALPLPGPLIGMLALTAFLALNRGPAARAVIACGERLLRHYALFFIPAGVGVMTEWATLRPDFLALALSLVGSSLLSLVATALVMRAVLARRARHARHASV